MKSRGKIIAVGSTKGGPGKTTIAGCMADGLSILGYKVAILDIDPNQNLTSWFNKAAKKRTDGLVEDAFGQITFESQLEDENIVKDCRRLSEAHDFVIVDVAGVKSQSLYVAAGSASLVVIPATPSEDDIREAIKTKKIVESASEMIGQQLEKDFQIPLRVVLNATQTKTIVHQHATESLAKRKFPIFGSTIGFRTVFRKARFSGSTPLRIEPHGEGSREIMSMIDEVLALLGQKRADTKLV